MTKKIFLALTCVLFISTLFAQNADDPEVKPILQNWGARDYEAAPVTKAELDTVIQAGIRAPSAMNRQPWRFTVVRTPALVRKIIRGAPDGNVAIVVSLEDGRRAASQLLDAGLAVENMYLAAQAIGLGSRIYTGPVDDINKNMKADLGIDKGWNAVAVVRVGRLPKGVDAVSSASSRDSAEKIVTYK